jgi:hypothetical protein
LELNGIHQLLIYADDVDILGKKIHTIMKNTEALLKVSKDDDPQVTEEKTKYTFFSSPKCKTKS